jgi:hypothetical protein
MVLNFFLVEPLASKADGDTQLPAYWCGSRHGTRCHPALARRCHVLLPLPDTIFICILPVMTW